MEGAAVQHRPPSLAHVPPSSVVERKTFNLVVVGSIPTVGDFFFGCALNADEFSQNKNSQT